MTRARIPVPPEIREEVRQKFGGCCAYCGETLKKSFHIDHVIPVAGGGVDDISNYFPACRECNAFKSDYSLSRFREVIEEQTLKHLKFRIASKYHQIEAKPSKVEFHFEKCGHSFDEELVLELMKKSSIPRE